MHRRRRPAQIQAITSSKQPDTSDDVTASRRRTAESGSGTNPGWLSARRTLRARELQYGGSTLDAAVGCYAAFVAAPRARDRLLVLRDWRGLVALMSLLLGLPCVDVPLSTSPSGRAIREHLMSRSRLKPPQRRVAQGVLVLPTTVDEYRRGRSRQAMRTNVRHAVSSGMTCRRLTTDAERLELAEHPFFPGSHHRGQLLANRINCEYWVVFDIDGNPLGLGVVSVDETIALLWALGTADHPARWLLNFRITEALIDAGVQVLLVKDRHVLQMNPAVRYFQMLLGYRVVHLSLADAPSGRRFAASILRLVGTGRRRAVPAASLAPIHRPVSTPTHARNRRPVDAAKTTIQPLPTPTEAVRLK